MNDQDWKQKYLANLDQSETREKQWRSLESLLRQGLSRVALAAQGLDHQLDGDLSQLRQVIRGDLEESRLEAVVEDLSKSVTRLDEARSGKARSDRPQDLLLRWLEGLKLPAAQSRALKRLKTRIHDCAELAELEAPLRELAELLNQAMSAVAASTPARPGLMAKLFGNRTAATTAPGNATPAAPAAEATDNAALLGQFCIQLLDTLSLPDSLEPQAQALKDRLAGGLQAGAVSPTLNAIAGLVSTLRGQMEHETREMQEFLRQLTDNLQEIDQHLAGTKNQHRVARDRGRDLDAAVTAQVSEIETSVESEPEPAQLKQQIQARLDAIRQHLDQYRHAEDEHHTVLESRLRQLDEQVHSMETESQRLRERLREKQALALRDPLTGLNNRLAYDERLAQEYARARRYASALVLLVVDVDHFKTVNDSYGHKAGDKALLLIADQLRQNLRETDFLARLGGEEFVVIMPETELAAAAVAAEKLRAAVAACQFHYQGASVNITISSGLAQLTAADSAETLFQRADQAMYRAKQSGRNCCVSDSADT